MKKILIYLFLLAAFFLVSCAGDKVYSEKELFLLEELGIVSHDFTLISNDIFGQMETYAYTFTLDGEKNIGFAAFYHGNEKERVYNKDSLLILDYDIINDDKPFELYSSALSVPSKYLDESAQNKEFRYYYGNINDAKIVRIIIEQGEESQHIFATDGFYSNLTNNIMIPQNIKGLDEELEVIYEIQIYE